MNTLQAQAICLFESYDNEIIKLIKKHNNFLKKCNFNIDFFKKEENKNTEKFVSHIKLLSTKKIQNWYISLKIKKTIQYVLKILNKYPLLELEIKDYFDFYSKKFDYLKLFNNVKFLSEIYNIDIDNIYETENDYIHDEIDFSDYEYDADEELETQEIKKNEEIKKIGFIEWLINLFKIKK